MPTLTLRGAFIRFVDLRYEPKSKSIYTKINITAVYSKPVRDEMQWDELPESMPFADLEGEYTVKDFTMVPNGLDANAITLEATDMSGFSVHRVTSKDDKETTEEELRFQILTPDEHAASRIAKYLKIVGHGDAQMKIKYNAQSVIENQAAEAQQKLEGAETTPGDSEATGGKRGARNKGRVEPVN